MTKYDTLFDDLQATVLRSEGASATALRQAVADHVEGLLPASEALFHKASPGGRRLSPHEPCVLCGHPSNSTIRGSLNWSTQQIC